MIMRVALLNVLFILLFISCSQGQTKIETKPKIKEPTEKVVKTDAEWREILTAKENAPRRDWLQKNMGYLNSSRARAKVQHWFKLQAREDNVAAGRSLVEKLAKRLALNSLDYKAVSNYFGYQAIEDMYACGFRCW